MENLSVRPRLLLGYGDIGSRLAQLSVAQGIPVTAVRRTETTHAEIETIAADVTGPETIQRAVEEGPRDIVVTLTPSNYSEQGYRDSYLACAHALANTLPSYSPTSRVIFVSSTSVYGQNNGEWVDESSDTLPSSATAQVLIEAENALASAGIRQCNLRFSGIYGPGRTRFIDLTKSGKIAPPYPVHWTNRIHADDCAGVLDYLLRLAPDRFPSLVVATDSAPVPKHQVQTFIAQQLGMAVPDTEESLSEDTTATGKRCNNKRLLELGYEFLYPDYRAGFSALIAEQNQTQ